MCRETKALQASSDVGKDLRRGPPTERCEKSIIMTRQRFWAWSEFLAAASSHPTRTTPGRPSYLHRHFQPVPSGDATKDWVVQLGGWRGYYILVPGELPSHGTNWSSFDERNATSPRMLLSCGRLNNHTIRTTSRSIIGPYSSESGHDA